MPSPPQVVRVGCPGDLIAALPHLLGFVPVESVIVMALHPPRHRIGLTLRADLDSERYDEQVARLLARRIDHERPAAAAVIVVTDSGDDVGDLPRRGLVDRLAAAIRVPVRDALLSRHGRWWSYLCADGTCCPPEGSPVDPTSAAATALAAAHALHGRGVLPDREAVLRSVAPVAGVLAASMRQAVDRMSPVVAGLPSAERLDRTLGLVGDLLVRYDDPRLHVGEDDAAFLLLSCHDVRVRDAVLGRGSGGSPDETLLRLVGDVARRAMPPIDAPICTMWAWLAYVDGDGVLATAAVERALASDPAYSLARLLCSAIEAQLHPDTLRRAMRSGRPHRGGRSRAG